MTLLIVLLLATPAAAQEPTPLRWKEFANVPSRISDAAVATQVGADVFVAVKDHGWKGLGQEACTSGIVLASTSLLKHTIDRERPNGYDNKSFPSAHSAFAMAHRDWNRWVGWSLTVTTMWGRQAGGWHYLTDTLAGAAIGEAARRICH